MLCPEVWNFEPPKIITYSKKSETLDYVKQTISRNNFYKSMVVTCPDELNTPQHIQEFIVEDNEYYKVENCPVTELLEPVFIKNFIQNGYLYCLSTDKNCVVHNCIAITPDGILTLHILEYIFQTTGLDGIKRPQGYYEVKIDLKHPKNLSKTSQKLNKFETFNLYVVWEPQTEDICPSSIAKYFHDRGICVSVHSPTINKISPPVTVMPTLIDTDLEEMAEWIGLLALEADLSQTESYVSTYHTPDSALPMKSTTISLLIVKGFLIPTMINNVCEKLLSYVKSRDVDNYWSSLSVQSIEHSLWQWNNSSPRMFQYHDSSCSIFLTDHGIHLFSIGQVKYT